MFENIFLPKNARNIFAQNMFAKNSFAKNIFAGNISAKKVFANHIFAEHIFEKSFSKKMPMITEIRLLKGHCHKLLGVIKEIIMFLNEYARAS